MPRSRTPSSGTPRCSRGGSRSTTGSTCTTRISPANTGSSTRHLPEPNGTGARSRKTRRWRASWDTPKSRSSRRRWRARSNPTSPRADSYSRCAPRPTPSISPWPRKGSTSWARSTTTIHPTRTRNRSSITRGASRFKTSSLSRARSSTSSPTSIPARRTCSADSGMIISPCSTSQRSRIRSRACWCRTTRRTSPASWARRPGSRRSS